MKARAVVLKEYMKPFVIEEYDVPELEPGAILVKITQAGICGSDLHWWRGDRKDQIPPNGFAMGHEGTGIVAKLGKGVTTDSQGIPIKEGDRLMHYAVFPCFRCHHCLRGDPNICPNRRYGAPEAGRPPYFTGTYADYMYIRPGHPVFRVPDELPDGLLGAINCAWGTVTQGLLSAGVKAGQYVVLLGAGGLGLAATVMAKHMGAERVIILDRLENRLRLARELGADHTINIDEYNTPETRIQRVRELTSGRGADIIMELVGRSTLVSEGISMLSNGGTFVEIGQICGGQNVPLDPSTLLAGKRIMGNAMYRPHLLPLVMEFMALNHQRVPLHKIVSHKLKLADVNQAFVASEWNGRNTDVIRTMLVP